MEEADFILSSHTQDVGARHMTHHTCFGGGQERSEGVPPKATYSKVHRPKLGGGGAHAVPAPRPSPNSGAAGCLLSFNYQHRLNIPEGLHPNQGSRQPWNFPRTIPQLHCQDLHSEGTRRKQGRKATTFPDNSLVFSRAGAM